MLMALECPTSFLQDVQPLTDFSWVLTHLVLQDKAYAKFYQTRGGPGLVLDNSVNELLEPCSLEDMQKAAEVVRPNKIVPPDYLGDMASTLRELAKAIKIFGKEMLLPAIQGHELEGVYECARYIRELGFEEIAVPYDITCQRTVSLEEMADAREEVITRLVLISGFSTIHLLGMTTLEELDTYWSIPQVKSIDTGGPILNGLSGIRFGEGRLLPKRVPTLEQMPDETDILAELGPGESRDSRLADVYYNIAMLRKVTNGTG